jgi:hypothetical protein
MTGVMSDPSDPSDPSDYEHEKEPANETLDPIPYPYAAGVPNTSTSM